MFTEEQKSDIIDLYRNNELLKNIAIKYKCSDSVLIHWLKKWSIFKKKGIEGNEEYILKRFNELNNLSHNQRTQIICKEIKSDIDRLRDYLVKQKLYVKTTELNEDIITNIINDYKSGMPIPDVALKYSVGRDRCYKIINEHNAKIKRVNPNKIELTKNNIENIINLRENKYTIKQIEEKLKINRTLVRNVLKNNNIFLNLKIKNHQKMY